jgi:hypothetical protein
MERGCVKFPIDVFPPIKMMQYDCVQLYDGMTLADVRRIIKDMPDTAVVRLGSLRDNRLLIELGETEDSERKQ